MEMLQGVWKQHLRPRAVAGYGVKIFLPSPPNYVTRSPGVDDSMFQPSAKTSTSNTSMVTKKVERVFFATPYSLQFLYNYSF